MKNTKRILLYSPYLDIFGGGEKHYLSILTVFEEENYVIDLLWNDKKILDQIENKMSITFKNAFVKSDLIGGKNILEKIRLTSLYDCLIYVTDGSYFFSAAKKNYIFAMVPNRKLYRQDLLNKLKLINYNFITNSKFTQQHLGKWGINSRVLYPLIDQEYFFSNNNHKEKIILSVGRFFSHLHTKKQLEVIKAFIKIKHRNIFFKDFKLYLVGRLKEEDKRYLEEIKRNIDTRADIILQPNLENNKLIALYKKAMFYWHFTGFGVDEKREPEKVEHLGIAPLEAMAAGCLVYGYNAGGIKEIIEDGKNGFTFTTLAELEKKIKQLLDNSPITKQISIKASDYVKKNYSYEIFRNNVKDLFEL